MTDHTSALRTALGTLLRPLVRLLLRHGVPWNAFADILRQVYAEEAGKPEFSVAGRKQSDSRISVLTGLTRKEVRRLGEMRQTGPGDDTAAGARYNRAARVIAAWVRDPAFHDAGGAPAALDLAGEKRSFTTLVRLHSGDMPVRAVLDELRRVGAVVQEADGTVRLLQRSYVPADSAPDKIAILGQDVSDLVETIAHNLRPGASAPRFQRKVMYDNLPTEVIGALRAKAREDGQALIEGLDRWIAPHDRDINPDSAGTGRVRAGVGVYYFEELSPEQPSSDEEKSPGGGS